MTIKDTVYSEFEITSPIILELIKTKAFQRLKGISQFGIPNKYYHLRGYSRYEHSIGVYILLNILGACEKEQIAGLLHDISHTAFSHLIDWVIGDRAKEDYQDKRHMSVLEQKEIADILRTYGFLPEEIADYRIFSLLESDAPNLCADRIDYALRESSPGITTLCLPQLTVYDGRIVFSTIKSALVFAENFLQRQLHHWAGYEAVTRYVLFSNMIKDALSNNVITLEDLLQTDDFVIQRITRTKENKYIEVLKLLEKKKVDFLIRSKKPTKKKFRYVDPDILVHGKLIRLSHINNDFRKMVEHAKKLNEKGQYAGTLL